jgi:ribosomal protein S27AE
MTDDGQPHKQADDDSSKDDMQTYTCPRCGRVSYNPHDAEQRYCGACKSFEDQLELGAEPYWMQDIRIAQRAIERQRARGPEPEG